MSIEVLNVTKKFGDHVALSDVSLEVKQGELLALLGPSGSGKTSLLRIMAGLESPDSGSVHFRGEDATNRHARDRGVGFVFQHYALFRHMTVFENIAFGLRVLPKRVRPPEKQIQAVVNELLELVQLGWMGDRLPSQLSGGQRQRVALARALAVKPRVLLLDEPFGALDARVRKDLRRWLRQLQDELQVTTVLVTHDQEEALEVADRVVIMNDGRIEQEGSSDEVYSHPQTPFVYSFLGSVNLFHGRLREGRVDIGGGEELEAPDWPQAPEQAAVAFVRSHDIEVSRVSSGGSEIAATVRRLRVLGHVVRLDLYESSGRLIEVEIPKARFSDLELAKGDQVFVAVTQARVFPRGG